jgi:quercetin dioxygenase-like cupin family protein
MTAFIPLRIRPGTLHELNDSAHPVALLGWLQQALTLPDGGTCFGIATSDGVTLDMGYGPAMLRRGMFFVVNRGGTVRGGQGLVIFRPGYSGLPQIGGPLEVTGRLGYIDGCSDTLWVGPPRLGEPCLNHLHIPPHTDQTQHTHPSDRIGVIMNGHGECRTPDGVHSLSPGMGWVIPAGLRHSFFTTEEPLDVMAWHPDSDFGPRDEDHPMINRTLI